LFGFKFNHTRNKTLTTVEKIVFIHTDLKELIDGRGTLTPVIVGQTVSHRVPTISRMDRNHDRSTYLFGNVEATITSDGVMEQPSSIKLIHGAADPVLMNWHKSRLAGSADDGLLIKGFALSLVPWAKNRWPWSAWLPQSSQLG
jgi:hypothetical protein